MNDSAFEHSKNNYWTSLESFVGNIKRLTGVAKQFTETVIFIGPTPADQEIVDPMPWDTDKSYYDADIKRYDKALRETAKENGAGYIPLYDKFMATDYKKLLHDGAHPNSAGHQLIFETVRDYLLSKKII